MSRKLTLAVLILLIIVIGTRAFFALRAPLSTVQPTMLSIVNNTTSSNTINLNWPGNGAQAAIGIVGQGVLAASDTSEKPFATASIAKLITVLTVLNKKPLNDAKDPGVTITLNANDVELYNKYVAADGSVVPVNVGEQITERQMLEAMLLPSANNMADSLATWAFGSLPAYKVAATEMIKQLGLSHTTIGSDASGLDASTTSTASDIVKLGEAAAQNPVIVAIAAEPSAVLPVAGEVKNVNMLLGQQGINGLKTGNNDADPGAFVFSASYTPVGDAQPVTIIGSILNSASLWQAMNSSLTVLKSTQSLIKISPILPTDQAVAEYHVPWMDGAVTAIAKSNVNGLTWDNRGLQQPKINVRTISGPLKASTAVGQATGSYGSTQIVLSRDVTKPSLIWRLLHN